MATKRADPAWLAWQAQLRTLCSEMRMEASQMPTTSHGVLPRSHLYLAARQVEDAIYSIDNAILAAAAEEEK